ncbi:MAG TPA: translocation/assembly module TamB domain-containing protein, partial [Cytophagaceae bacterium]
YNNHKEINLEALRVRTFEFDGQRTFSLVSNFGSIDAKGNFKFTSLLNDLQTSFKEYKLNIANNKEAITNYYKNKAPHSRQKYELDFTVALQDVNTLLAIYVPNLYISPGVIIQGDFTSGYTTILNLNTKVDTILYANNEIYQSSVELSASKISDSSNVLGMVYISSEAQKLGTLANTEKIFFEGEWFNNSIDFRSSIAQAKSTNNASVIGNLTFQDDKEILVLRESNFNILNKTWGISGSNKIVFFPDEILFENFTLSNNQQSISVNGYFSNNEERTGTLIIDNLQMETINPIFTNTKLKGLLDGKLNINNFYKSANVEGEISLTDFFVDGFLIGDINANSEYNRSSEVLDLDVTVERLGKKIIEVEGYFKPQFNSGEEQMKLVALLDEAELGILQPLLSSFMSNIKGTVSGDFTLSGSLKDPIVNGVGEVKNGAFKIDYLGTTYTFNDEVYMEDNLIGFKKLRLKDNDGHIAVVDGGLYHDHFRDFIVDIKAKMKEFNVLKLTDKQNKLFYGDAFVSGDLEILGAFSNLEIVTNVTSNKGTKIYIPLNSSESVEQQSYITFKRKSDTGNKKDSLDLSGLRLEFNFDITEDAYAEIIFDKKAGDIIRGYGRGNIKMKIDTRGDFSMYGNYQITKGAYNFTLAGLINKEFDIMPNSSITWTGDPYAGLLDIKANYSQYVSLSPLIPATDSIAKKSPENRRKYPVDVEMKLVGNLLTPDIDLGIDILKFPGNLAGEVTAYEAKVKTDEQELNRQVFSLLVLASISPVGSFSGVNSTGNNLSEMLSNQLSSWLSQVDENLQIDVNLNSLDRNALNTFQLRMSYTLMDGRLRITRDGSFQNVQNNQQANFTNIAGEWTLEYLLSPDGKFRLKLYNKANQNMLLASTGVNSGTSAGFSLLHTQSFDGLKDLFKKKAKNPDDTLFVPSEMKKVKSKPAPVQKKPTPAPQSNVQSAGPARRPKED